MEINFSKKNISSIDSNLYNCVVANIQSDVLMTYCNKFTRVLQKKGNLVLSGILDYEVEVVRQTFQKQLRTDHLNAKIYTRRKKEWCALQIKLL
jgi:ribosomal protein L11 methylase PrmA